MPMKAADYPPDWKQISKRIRERAGNKCEWCGIPNYSLIHRGKEDMALWILDKDWQRLSWSLKQCWNMRTSKIVLTVAHLNHTPSDCRDENLACLCNRCHLNYDAKHHAQHASQTRRLKREAATGQLSFLEDAS